jgi:hypothetical protein
MIADQPASALDDERDREELRRRYYGLLQELRVLLPGVQVLVAFLLTVPFAERFTELDRTGQILYAISLVCAVIAVIAFVAPTAFHRMGLRTSRAERLVWAIKATRFGIAFMALSLECALFVICRLIFDTMVAAAVVGGLAVLMVAVWVVLPVRGGRGHPLAD